VIEQIGSPLELYDDPDNLFVASFIGSPAINVFSGRYEQIGVSARVRIGDFFLPAPTVHAADGQLVSIGVRPEHLQLAEDGLPFVVDVIEPTGASTELFGSVAGQPCCVMVNGRTAQQSAPVARLRASVDHIYFFDPDTGRRMR
jgi:multiple sugar transport system ATP-binding protein